MRCVPTSKITSCKLFSDAFVAIFVTPDAERTQVVCHIVTELAPPFHAIGKPQGPATNSATELRPSLLTELNADLPSGMYKLCDDSPQVEGLYTVSDS
jgi:hypothetical protein